MAEIKTKTLSKCECTIYDVDNRIRIENGRFYTTRTPYENGKQSDFPELVDVTEDVVDAILKVLNKRKMRETW